MNTTREVLFPDASVVDLGQVPIGQTQEVEIFVRNRGPQNSIVGLRSLVLTPTIGAFSTTTDTPVTAALLPGYQGREEEIFIVRAQFSPTTSGPQSAVLTIAFDLQGTPSQMDVTLTGTGTTGLLQATPGSIDFGGVFTGRARTQNVAINNVGNAPVVVGSVAFAGSAGFVVDAVTLPATIAPGASLPLVVRLTAASPGPLQDILVVDDTDGNSLEIATTAVARDEGDILAPDTLAFGPVYAGTTVERVVTVDNDGLGALTLSSASITGTGAPRYAIVGTNLLPEEIEAGSSFDLRVSYTAPAPTGFNDAATLTLRSDDPDDDPITIELSGTGVRPVIAVSPGNLNLGVVDIGLTNSATFEIRNTGVGGLSVNSIVTNNAAFSVSTAPLPTVVNFGASGLIVTVTFAAGAPGAANATITITSNDAVSPSVVVTANASGRSCDPRAGTTVVQVGNQCTYSCATNFHDLDGDVNNALSNGCEYACTFASASDAPDDAYVDSNCDGIDGEVNGSIFVNGANGNDDFPGTRAQPKRTINGGIVAA
ncbi:MAG TPA: choice-of-anchor D domain-containing protein, partial [Myxococcota bacterium]